jgi:uncharacterized protein (TIGR03435 family)
MGIKETRTEELLALGVFGRGSRLVDRIERLLECGRVFSPRISGARVAASSIALFACVFAGSLAPRLIAFAQTRPSFEVASVRAVEPGANAEPSIEISGGNLTIRLETLRDLVAWAYGQNGLEIAGANSLDNHYFDIAAKAAGPASPDQLKLMLQTLLEERFKLKLHREQKIEPLYSLIVDKSGPKMHEMKEAPRQGGRLGWKDTVFTYQFVNHVSELAVLLPAFLDSRPVQDKTGLTGVYEIDLSVELDAEQLKRVPQPGVTWNGFGYSSGVFDAVAKLGLKLEATKGPVDFLIIDHAEKPDAN